MLQTVTAMPDTRIARLLRRSDILPTCPPVPNLSDRLLGRDNALLCGGFLPSPTEEHNTKGTECPNQN